MTEAHSQDLSILERPFMEFPPFGVDGDGEKIVDISGTIVKANVEYLEEYVAQTKGREAGDRAVQDLCRLLKERLRDSAYHNITPEFLKNIWHSYSYEFVCYLREFCEQLSGDPQFHFNAGKVKHVTPTIAMLGRHIPMRLIYGRYPDFVKQYTKGVVDTEVGRMTGNSAVIRLKFTARAHRQFGPYWKRCAYMVCQAGRGALITLPERIHRLPPAAVRDLTCMVNGDEWCEWEVTWMPEDKGVSFHPFREMIRYVARLLGKTHNA
jgi:hypothetical protein